MRSIYRLHATTGDDLEITRFVGQRKLSITADTYTHVLLDDHAVPYIELCERGS